MSPPSHPKKILAFHGVAQSGPVFERRCKNITTHLSALNYTIYFLTAPHPIAGTAYTIARQPDHQPSDPERSWWTTSDPSSSHPSLTPFLTTVATAITQHGPFSALLGFSQGGCAAASIAALLEYARRDSPLAQKYLTPPVLAIQPPIDFLLLFSANPYRFPHGERNDLDVRPLFYPEGFTDYPYSELAMPTPETLMLSSGRGFREVRSEPVRRSEYPPAMMPTPSSNTNPITTPTLFFYGSAEWATDPFSRARQQWFISRFNHIQVHAHPWRHAVPRTDAYAEVVVEFVRRVEGRPAEGAGKGERKRRTEKEKENVNMNVKAAL